MSFFNKVSKVNYEELYKRELQKNKELQNQCLDLKDKLNKSHFDNLELNSSINRYKFYINELENKLKNSSLIPKKVTLSLMDQVKNMLESGMTYRDIAPKLNISIKTISRIVNGYYDNKF
ncbi:MAG: hypothetical protein ACRC1T_11945 [Clostridium chrysemydis]|uniref:hypothetical protein n=1 Tax=Clostridium chrysemydis TaxID=2665504 RepID=UPI003F356E37